MKTKNYQHPSIKILTSVESEPMLAALSGNLSDTEPMLAALSGNLSDNPYSGVAGARTAEEVFDDNADYNFSQRKSVWDE